jgi:hypothetical protein
MACKMGYLPTRQTKRCLKQIKQKKLQAEKKLRNTANIAIECLVVPINFSKKSN